MKQISNSHLRWPKGRRSCVKYISKERINNESICEYLQITPGDFFNEDSEAPREVRELMEKIEKLTPEQRTLIRQVVEQFLGE